VSSSFSASRLLPLPVSKEEAEVRTAYPSYKDAPAEAISDESLIAQIRSGNQEALAVLFDRYARLIWSIAKKILRDKGEADDLVQEVFLLVYRKAPVFDSSKGTPRSLIVHMTYQRAITRRQYLLTRHFRGERNPEQTPEKIAAPVAPFYDESIEAHFGREGLRNAFGELSKEQRETLRLYFFEGYTLDEIAIEFSQSLGNVKHHYYRGLEKLRRSMPKR
jgi:RNA polymerase sigma-70 factor, ECF subfamily